MEKKNTLLLTVIAIATLLVAVVGATFAFFASQTDTNANIPVNVKTAGKAGAFQSQATENIHISVTSAAMLESVANNETPINISASDKDTATVTANLSAPAGETVTCTYDVVWVWGDAVNTYNDTPNQNYVATTGIGEGTIGNELTLALYSGTDTTGTAVFQEKNMDFTGVETEQIKILPSDSTTVTAYILKKQTITATGDAAADKAETQSFTAKVRFYNQPLDQSIQEDKTFLGNIRIANVQC